MKLIVSLAAIFLLLFGCNSNPTDSDIENNFSVFLTKDIENNFPNNISIDKVILEDEPILSIKSIESYEWAIHKILFTNEAKEKIKLKEPLFGKYFIVIAQNQRIYWGLFTDAASSISCQNPVILLLPRHPDKSSFLWNSSFVIDRAYPEYFGNENDKDLRNDLRIYKALKTNGKLK